MVYQEHTGQRDTWRIVVLFGLCIFPSWFLAVGEVLSQFRSVLRRYVWLNTGVFCRGGWDARDRMGAA